MPAVDMPLDELRNYRGTNPKPNDFDAYWDEALDELDGLTGEFDLAPADFSVPFAECLHMSFTGVEGARIHAKLVRPRAPAAEPGSPHPAVILFHGYSGDSGPWQATLAYAAMGFTVAAMDCRGQGGLSQDPGGVLGNTLHGHIIRGLVEGPRKLLYRRIFLDTALLARIVMSMEDVDETRVGAAGPSQGGGLTLACAALEPRIRRAAPLYPFLCDYRRVWDLDLGQYAYQELKQHFRRFDPTHARAEEIFTTLGYIDVQHLVSRIRAEVLMGTGLMDEICPASTQFAAYNKIESPKEMVVYPDYGHERIDDFTDRTLRFLAAL